MRFTTHCNALRTRPPERDEEPVIAGWWCAEGGEEDVTEDGDGETSDAEAEVGARRRGSRDLVASMKRLRKTSPRPGDANLAAAASLALSTRRAGCELCWYFFDSKARGTQPMENLTGY